MDSTFNLHSIAVYQPKHHVKSRAEILFDQVFGREVANKSCNENTRMGRDMSNDIFTDASRPVKEKKQPSTKPGVRSTRQRKVKQVRFLDSIQEDPNEGGVGEEGENEASPKKKKRSAAKTYSRLNKEDQPKRRATIRKKKYPECTKEAVLRAFKEAQLPDYDEIARLPLSIKTINTQDTEPKSENDITLTKRDILKPFLSILDGKRKSTRRSRRTGKMDSSVDKENPTVELEPEKKPESQKASDPGKEPEPEQVLESEKVQQEDPGNSSAPSLSDSSPNIIESSPSSPKINVQPPTLSSTLIMNAVEETLPQRSRAKSIASTPLPSSKVSPEFPDISFITSSPLPDTSPAEKEKTFRTPKASLPTKKKLWNVADRKGSRLVPPHPYIFNEPKVITESTIEIDQSEHIPLEMSTIHNSTEMDKSIQKIFSATSKTKIRRSIRASQSFLRSSQLSPEKARKDPNHLYRQSLVTTSQVLHSIGKSCRTIIQDRIGRDKIIPAARKSSKQEVASTQDENIHPQPINFSVAFSQSFVKVGEKQVPLTAKEKVLALCQPPYITTFGEILPPILLHSVRKIGEGSYGEVFESQSENGDDLIIKVIPIPSSGSEEDSFAQTLPELVISLNFNDLRSGNRNKAPNFVNTISASCVRGKFPSKLAQAWHEYDKAKDSENEPPEKYGPETLHLIMQLANGGVDLETYDFKSSAEALSVIFQTAYALAAAEEEFKFEHRDLHWGNLLIMPTKLTHLDYKINGEEFKVPTSNILVSIIDFTLSRISKDGFTIYDDLSKYEDLFQGEGDYQFDIYRLMRDHNKNNWQKFSPFTNILWIHYLLDKLIESKKYKSRSKGHHASLEELKNLRATVKNYKSAKHLATSDEFKSLLS